MYEFVWPLICCVFGTSLLATLITLFFLFNPKYIIYIYLRLQVLKLGLTKKTLKLSDTFQFSYIERGCRSTATASVLLVHGLTGSKENFLNLIKHLPSTLHVIAVDQYAHGETSYNESDFQLMTYVEYLKQFVDHVGLSRVPFHMVGLSFGGHVCGVYSTLYPDDLISLSLMCPQGISYEKEEEMLEEAKKTNRFVLFPRNEEEYHELIKTVHHKPPKIPSWLLPGLIEVRKAREVVYMEVLKSLYEPHSKHLLEKNLHKLSVPLLVIWGKEDKLIDIECLETMKKKLPTPPRRIEVLEHVGHGVHFERPRKCAFILIDFFNSFL